MSLNCNKCKLPFNQYDHPKMLPCGNTICTKCEFHITFKETINRQFKCSICIEYHYMPENGFVLNQQLFDLINQVNKSVTIRSQKHEQLQLSLSENKKLVRRIENFDIECKNEVNEYCSDIKRQIQLVTELKILKFKEKENSQVLIDHINKSNEELIKIVDEYEQKCFDDFINNRADSIKVALNKLINETNCFLNEKQEYLQQTETNEEYIEIYINESISLNLKLQKELKKLIKLTLNNNNKIEFIASLDESIYFRFIDYDKCFTNILILSDNDDDENIIKLIDIESNECIQTYAGQNDTVCIKIAPPNMIISGDENGSIKIWNMKTGENIRTIREHTDTVKEIIILSRNIFATYSNDKTIKLFDLDSFNCIKTLYVHEKVLSIDKISNNTLVTCSNKIITIWYLNMDFDGQCLKEIRDEEKRNNCVRVITDDKLACGSGTKIKIWNFETGICLKTIDAHLEKINYIEIFSNEQIISGDFMDKIKIWNFNNGECLKSIHTNAYISKLVKLSKNVFFSSECDVNMTESIKMYDTETGNCFNSFAGLSFDLI